MARTTLESSSLIRCLINQTKKLSDYRLQKISTSFDVVAQELKAFKTKDPVLRQEIETISLQKVMANKNAINFLS